MKRIEDKQKNVPRHLQSLSFPLHLSLQWVFCRGTVALVKEEVGPSGEVDGNRKKMVCFNCFKLCCSVLQLTFLQ